MSENIYNITVKIKDLDPLEFEVEEESPILKILCQALAGVQDLPPVIYLELETEDGNKCIYFPRESMVALESDKTLPSHLFEVVDPEDAIPEHLRHLDPEWQTWVLDNLKRGCNKDDLYQIMSDSGITHSNIETALQHQLTRDLVITEDPTRESIEPVSTFANKNVRRVESEHIELYQFSSFLDPEECDHVEKIMGDNLTRSSVVGVDGPDHRRTSHTCYLSEIDDEKNIATLIQDRICQLIDADINSAEPIQCQVYSDGDEYRAHHDYFSNIFPDFQNRAGVIRGGQRTWSNIIYLCDSEPGSGTRFPKLNLELNPKRGDMIFWKNLYPSGKPNPYTFHQGLPAKDKKKTIITLWIRDELPEATS